MDNPISAVHGIISLLDGRVLRVLTDDDETIQEAAKDALEELEGDEDPLGFKFHG